MSRACSCDVKITKEQMQVFEGIVISDGHLEKIRIKRKNSRLRLGVKHKEFVEKIVEYLPCFSWSKIITRKIFDKRTEKFYTSNRLDSRVNKFFTEQRNRWYPNNKKIVPKDICISKNLLLWWYLGDGHLHKKKARPNSRRIILATNSFLELDNLFLIDLLKQSLGNKTIYLEDNKIIIARESLCNFVDIVGSISPVEVYQYKFDFGQYFDKEYFKKSYNGRPIQIINKYRKKYKVRELDYKKVKEHRYE